MSEWSLEAPEIAEPDNEDESLTPTTFRDEEIWNLDASLARLIADSVRRLRDMDHGYPFGSTMEDWRAILTKIADDFQAYSDAVERGGEDIVRPDAAFDLLGEWWQALWD